MFPTHWLVFALAGRAQKWPLARLGGIVALVGTGHVAVTAAIGIALALAGGAVAGAMHEHLEGAERLGGLALVAFGAAYMIFDLRHVGHRHIHHVHGGEVHDAHHHQAANLSDRAAITSLVLAVSISPCIALAPVFFQAGAIGWGATALVAAINAAVTVPLMTVMAVLAGRGLRFLPLERLERHERVIVGALIAAIGVYVLAFHHHPAEG